MFNKRKSAAVLVMILSVVSLSMLTACSDFFVSENATDHVSLSATAAVITTNGVLGAQSLTLSATAVTVGGATSDVTTTATWASSDPSIATVDATGKITAVAAGTVTVSATSGGQSGKATVVVVTSSIGTFAVTPASVTLHLVSNPTSQQLTATLTLGSGSLDVTQIATWASDTTSVATVSNTGLVRGVAGSGNILGTPATANVTASIATVTGTLTASSKISVDGL
jgi:uncharacterized protein YjdB